MGRVLCGAALLFAGAVACGGGGGAGSPSGGITSAGGEDSLEILKAVETACTHQATAECAHLESCSSLVMQTRYGTVDMCEFRLTATCKDAMSSPSTGMTTATSEACATAFPSWTCDDYLSNVKPPSACVQRKGALEEGAGCAYPSECGTGFCAIDPHAVCGTCTAQPKAGAACDKLTTCGQGLVCFPDTKVCGTYVAAHDACDKSAPCGPHLSCVGADEDKGTKGECTASAAKRGDACDPALAKGTGCDFDLGLGCDTATLVCAAIVVSDDGGSCDLDEHKLAVCSASGSCSTSKEGATGTCAGASDDGADCSTEAGGAGCLAPARCIVAKKGDTKGTCQVEQVPICK
jgi:hypothetical protein